MAGYASVRQRCCGLLTAHEIDAGGKGADQMQGRAAATTDLAVQAHHFALRQTGNHTADPTAKFSRKRLGIYHRKDPAKGFMRGNAVLQLQIASKPVQFLLNPSLNLDKVIRSGQNAAYRDDPQVNQIVFNLLRDYFRRTRQWKMEFIRLPWQNRAAQPAI